MRLSHPNSREAGFTLIEAMAAVAAMAAIIATVGAIAGQWLPHWRRGLVELQRADLLSLGLERVAADVAAAKYVTANGDAEEPFFVGSASSVTLVRAAIGPGSGLRLETVRISEIADGPGFAIVRARAAFAPSPTNASPAAFTDSVVLVRSPFRVSLAYAGTDRIWTEAWEGRKRLPDAVRLTVRDGAGGRVLAASTAVVLKVTAPAQDKSKTVPDTQPSASAGTSIADQRP